MSRPTTPAQQRRANDRQARKDAAKARARGFALKPVTEVDVAHARYVREMGL